MTSRELKLGMMLHVTSQADQTPQQTYADFTKLVEFLDQQGFDEAWVTEHHFNPYSLTPAPLLLMAHFLAHTQRLKLGAAAVLIGFHNPIEVSEQLATLQALYPQRVLCGFAKGGPFEAQNAVFKADKDLSRNRMLEAMPAMMALFSEQKSTHQGAYYQWENVELEPKISIDPHDFYLASSDPASIALAAKHQLGLMAAQFWPLEKIADNIQQYQAQAKPSDGQFMAARGVFIADHQDDAEHQAWLHVQNLRSRKAQLWGAEKKGPMAGVEPEELLARMLVGTVDDVIKRTRTLLNVGVNHLALNPLTNMMPERFEQLTRFKQEVWTQL